MDFAAQFELIYIVFLFSFICFHGIGKVNRTESVLYKIRIL